MRTITAKDVHAYIAGDVLVLEDFREEDAEVVGYVREQEDLDAAVRSCLRIGARALRVAGATLDGALVERRFNELQEKLGVTVDEFASHVDEKADELLSEEDGQLATALREWREEVEKLLGETFDEDSRKSVIAKMDALLATARSEQTKAVRRLLDPHDEESPLGLWRAAILETVRERSDRIEHSLSELSSSWGSRMRSPKNTPTGQAKGPTSSCSCSSSWRKSRSRTRTYLSTSAPSRARTAARSGTSSSPSTRRSPPVERSATWSR